MMQSDTNTLVIASAGSGKTTFLVTEALARPGKKIAILTYTINSLNEIKKKFYEIHGGIPKDIDIVTWFTFLLQDCARPYQRSVYSKRRVKTIYFTRGRSAPYIKYTDTEKYYFWNEDEIYSDKIARFIIDCEKKSNGLVTKRLASIYDEVFIDEFQDMSGYDLEVIETFLRASFRMIIVGDPRQCTYTTNNSPKNSKYCGTGILKKAEEWKSKNLCQIKKQSISFRCNQKICDFSDRLWTDIGIEKTQSYNPKITEHDGIFIVSKDNLCEYVRNFSPILLRYDKKTETYGYPALNFGNAKGLTFDRVLIVPHGPIKKYLQYGNVNDIIGSREKFYVAVTRARHSVAFLYDGKYFEGYIEWNPPTDCGDPPTTF